MGAGIEQAPGFGLRALLRALLVLCTARCGAPFFQAPVRHCLQVSSGWTNAQSVHTSFHTFLQPLLTSSYACPLARRPGCHCALGAAHRARRRISKGHVEAISDSCSDEHTGPGLPGRAPRRLPPAGASSFWDREHASAAQQEEYPPAAGNEVPEDTTEVLVLGASRPHSATVIWLHGDAGDPPRGWLRAVSKLNMPWCKFLLPIALSRSGASNGDEQSSGYYLLEPTSGWAAGGGEGCDVEDLWGAVRIVHDLLDSEAALGMPPNQIVVGGLGQGAAVALLAALTYPRQLAGAAAFAGYLPPALLSKSGGIRGQGVSGAELDVAVTAAYLPILMCHGSR